MKTRVPSIALWDIRGKGTLKSSSLPGQVTQKLPQYWTRSAEDKQQEELSLRGQARGPEVSHGCSRAASTQQQVPPSRTPPHSAVPLHLPAAQLRLGWGQPQGTRICSQSPPHASSWPEHVVLEHGGHLLTPLFKTHRGFPGHFNFSQVLLQGLQNPARSGVSGSPSCICPLLCHSGLPC